MVARGSVTCSLWPAQEAAKHAEKVELSLRSDDPARVTDSGRYEAGIAGMR